MRTFARSGAILLLLGGCSLPSARDDLGALMQQEVGRTAEDPGSYRAAHPKLRIGARALANGNTEEEYLTGFRDNCHVLFEVDPRTRKAVNWRFAQPDDDCILVAPLTAPPAKN